MGLLTAIASERRARPTSGLASPAGWLLDLFGGTATGSGKRVTADNALTVSTVFACVRIIAETCATLPIRVYQVRAERGKDARPQHAVAQLLARRPNRWQTPAELREMLHAHVELRGNGYAWKRQDGGGRIVELVPMHPDRVKVAQMPDLSLWYEWRPVYDGKPQEPRILSQDEVLHLRSFGTDGVVGLSTVALARETIGLAMAAQEHGARVFSNGARPGGILSHEKALSDQAYKRLRDYWENRHQGSANAHKIAILEEGMTWQSVGMSNEDTQWLDGRKFERSEVAAWFGVPPHMIGDLERSTNNNIEQQALEFVQHCLRPRLVRVEQSYERDLLLERDQATHSVKHVVEGLLRGDFKSRQEGYAQGRNGGWLSVNDIRELEDQNPIGPEGDVYLQPVNMVPLGSDPLAAAAARADREPPADAPPAAGARGTRAAAPVTARSLVVRHRLVRAARGVFADAAARCLRREVEATRRQLRRLADAPAADVLSVVAGLQRWQAEFLEEHRGQVARALAPAARSLAETVAAEAAWEVQGEPLDAAALDVLVTELVGGMAAREAQASRGLLDAVGEATTAADAAATLDAVLVAWEADADGRAAACARRESVQLAGAVARATWRAAGVAGVRVAADPACAVGAALDGRTVGAAEPVLAAGATLALADGTTWAAPRALAHPPFCDGCTCGLAPVLTLPSE